MIQVGDKVYWCFFYAHDLSKFELRSGVASRISNGFAFDCHDKLLSSVDELFRNEKEAIIALTKKLQKEQDLLKNDWAVRQRVALNRIETERYQWLEADREVNNKIGYLIAKGNKYA